MSVLSVYDLEVAFLLFTFTGLNLATYWLSSVTDMTDSGVSHCQSCDMPRKGLNVFAKCLNISCCSLEYYFYPLLYSDDRPLMTLQRYSAASFLIDTLSHSLCTASHSYYYYILAIQLEVSKCRQCMYWQNNFILFPHLTFFNTSTSLFIVNHIWSFPTRRKVLCGVWSVTLDEWVAPITL